VRCSSHLWTRSIGNLMVAFFPVPIFNIGTLGSAFTAG
jgi:hypothetical protein